MAKLVGVWPVKNLTSANNCMSKTHLYFSMAPIRDVSVVVMDNVGANDSLPAIKILILKRSKLPTK